MAEIPDDVIKAANEFQAMVDADPKAYVAFDIAVLAIMAERERCTKIAEMHGKEVPAFSKWIGEEIAASIRNTCGGKAPATP